MNLPLSNIFQKKEKVDYFLAILLKDDSIKVIVFEEIAKKIKVITTHIEHFSTSLEESSVEDWISIFDKAIGTAENTLPPSVELRKTVFGVKENWVEESKIKKEYITKLKKISEELDLEPIGFLVFSEAIAHLLQDEEGAPVSAILVEAGKENVIITILRAGRIVETRYAKIEESLVLTVDELLKGITSMEILPSRLILFDGDDVKHLAQKFTSHQWSKSLPFLHMPQITVLTPDFDSKAVLFGTASQLQLEVSSSEIGKAAIASSVKHNEADKPEHIERDNEEKKEELKKEVESKHEDKAKAIISDEHFGFVENEDIAENEKKHHDEKEKQQDEIENEIKGAEITSPEEESDETIEESIYEDGGRKKSVNMPKLSTLFSFFNKFKKGPAINESANKPRPKFIIPLIITALLLAGALGFYMFVLRATITLQVQANTIDKDADITFSTTKGTDLSNNTLHGDSVSVSEDGNATTNATGSKDVGTPAKGTVTIFNNNDSSKIITSGTTITSSNGLKFTVDNNTTVASASGDIFSGTKPGTADVSITATDIGTDYNLPSGTKFSVGSSSTIAAKNNDAFSGGSKKKATVVSKDDLAKVLSDLQKTLDDKAKNDMRSNLGDSKELLPAVLKTDIQKKTYDKKENDQAQSVTLHATIVYNGLTYDKNQLVDYSKELMKDKLTNDNQLTDKGITYDIGDVSVKDDKNADVKVTFHAALLPIIDTKDLAKKVAGKSFSEAKTLLTNQSQISDVTIVLNPNVFFLHYLPRSENHITIQVKNQ